MTGVWIDEAREVSVAALAALRATKFPAPAVLVIQTTPGPRPLFQRLLDSAADPILAEASKPFMPVQPVRLAPRRPRRGK